MFHKLSGEAYLLILSIGFRSRFLFEMLKWYLFTEELLYLLARCKEAIIYDGILYPFFLVSLGVSP